MRRTIPFLAALILAGYGSGCRDSFIGPTSLPKPANEERVYFSALEPKRPGQTSGFNLGPVSSVTTDGGDRQKIPNPSPAMILSAPKNGKIVYYLLKDLMNDYGRVVVANPDGSNERVIAQGVPGKMLVIGPAVLSPDGSMVSYAIRELPSLKTYMCLADINGKVLHQLPMSCDCDPYVVKFSPDGRNLAYLGSSDGDNRIHVVDVQTGEAYDIGQNVGKSISWSPDGLAIAYSEGNNAYLRSFPYIPVLDPIHSSAISVVDVDGNKIKRVLSDTAEVFDVAWSPNGSAIAYARRVGPATIFNTDIWLINVAGSTRRRLVVGKEEANIRPQWTPNGMNVIFTSIPKGESGLMPQVRKYDMTNSSISVIAEQAFGAILD